MTKFQKFFYAGLLIISLLFFFRQALFAQSETDKRSQELQQKINEYTKKISELQEQKNTLASQIRYMDTQIALTILKIQQTEETMKIVKKEIESISEKIDGLNNTLDYLGEIITFKIAEGYKTRSASLLDLFLDAENFPSLINSVKYLKATQDNDRRIAFQAQQAKLNFEDQKQVREKKKKQLEALTITLNNQKRSLANQKTQKENLLVVTQNDEKRYQQLLEEAQKQLSSFKSFVQSAGGGAIPANGFGSGSDGWYYSQRDERWAYKTIGYSRENLLEVGCLIADIAMIMKKYGVDWTPFDIAANPTYFFSNTAYMLKPSQFSWPIGMNYINISKESINDEIQAGRPVIVGLYAGKYGTHYVILKKVEGDDYIMHDPYYGPDKKFSEYYKKSAIFTAAVFK